VVFALQTNSEASSPKFSEIFALEYERSDITQTLESIRYFRVKKKMQIEAKVIVQIDGKKQS
jgi:hypothetical protein